jgi:hypothetical protein
MFLSHIKIKVESHSSRLKPVEGRISRLEDKIDIKKMEEYIEKRLRVVKGI